MADRYVWSGATGSANGSSWANAHVTISAAITASTAGDRFFVAHDHSETAAANITWAFKGSPTSPDTVFCVNRAGSVPPVTADLTTGAVVQNSGNFNITVGSSNCLYMRGIELRPGAAGNNANSQISLTNGGSQFHIFENCTFWLNTSSTTPGLVAGNGSVRCRNCTVRFNSTGQGLTLSGTLDWRNDNGVPFLHASSSIPLLLVEIMQFPGGNALFSGLDLSAINTTLVTGVTTYQKITFRDCKLHASVTVAATPTGVGGNRYVDLINCDDGTDYRFERYSFDGPMTTETTIKRTAGADDETTSGYCWKLVNNANAERVFPFETLDGIIFIPAAGSSKTLTVHIVTDNVTLTDAEIWLEVEYLGSSASPIAYRVDDACAWLGTPANQTSDSGEAWTTTGLTTPVKQKLQVTFTPQMIGPALWRVKFCKPSTTVYVDPNPDLT